MVLCESALFAPQRPALCCEFSCFVLLISRPQALTWPHGVMVPSQAMGTKGYRKEICLIPSLIRLYHALRPGKGAAGVRYSEENTGSGDLGT